MPKGTWVFKLKRLPDGTPSRFKARFCARGDLQKEGVDFFDTYAPVVQWSTIRLLLSTVLTEGWASNAAGGMYECICAGQIFGKKFIWNVLRCLLQDQERTWFSDC